MPDVDFTAGLRMTVLVSSLLGIGPVWGQAPFGDPYSAERSRPPEPAWLPGRDQVIDPLPALPQPTPAGPATVSAYSLRHPISSKTRHMLTKAIHLADLGNDRASIQMLLEAVAQQPSAAPYVDNLLGLEYLKTQQYAEAHQVFEEAVRLVPDVSDHHSNLGVSLALMGEWDSAEVEARKALHLDHTNPRAKKLLTLLTSWKDEYHEKGFPGWPRYNAPANALNRPSAK